MFLKEKYQNDLIDWSCSLAAGDAPGGPPLVCLIVPSVSQSLFTLPLATLHENFHPMHELVYRLSWRLLQATVLHKRRMNSRIAGWLSPR